MDLHKRASKSRGRPASGLRPAKGSQRDSKVQYALLVVALCVIYFIGYKNGQSMSALTAHTQQSVLQGDIKENGASDDSHTELDELGLSQNTRVAMGLTVLQNAQVRYSLVVCIWIR